MLLLPCMQARSERVVDVFEDVLHCELLSQVVVVLEALA